MWWCLSFIRREHSLPATTSEVPMKLSRIVVYFGDFSLRVFDAKRQRSVAMHSIAAPANGETWKKFEWKLRENQKKTWDLLASQPNSLQKLCPCVFALVLTTRRTAQTATRSNRPSIAPTFSMQHHAVSCGLQPCLPCACRDMQLRHPTLVTTKLLAGTGKLHKLRLQSCQRLEKTFMGQNHRPNKFPPSTLPMINSKQVEHSSAAAIASKINSRTSPWIDVKRSRTFRATCASAQHKTINAELIKRSVSDILAMNAREILCECQIISLLVLGRKF